MQKHALRKQYATVFDPLPFPRDGALYGDRKVCHLPPSEDFPYLHYHDCYEIGLCEGGDGLFLAEGRYNSVSEGDCLFLPPEHRHYSRSLSKDAPCRCWFVYVRPEAVRSLLSQVPGTEIPTVIRQAEHPQATALLGELVRRARSSDPHREAGVFLRLALFLTEAAQWFSKASKLSPESQCKVPTDEIAASIAEYLSLHYGENTSSEDLAELCHLSASQLRRRFTAVYGVPPIAYRNSIRCRIASELLLRTDRTVAQIAEQVGYPSPSDFSRAFKGSLGSSPSEYRKASLEAGQISKIP